MMGMVIRRAMNSSRNWRVDWKRPCARSIRSPDWAATSLPRSWTSRFWNGFLRLAERLLANGVTKDKTAVSAALSSGWSNGQAEGQICKLKLVKRQMYGRGKLDLLQARVIGAT